MWISCALSAYSEWGARISKSAISANLPPFFPVNTIVFIPSAFAAWTARITFFEFPEVEIPSKTSFDFPKPSTYLEKTKSYP